MIKNVGIRNNYNAIKEIGMEIDIKTEVLVRRSKLKENSLKYELIRFDERPEVVKNICESYLCSRIKFPRNIFS